MKPSAGKSPETAAKPADTGPMVGSISAALAVLEYLSKSDEPKGGTAIARTLGISTSSCFNILKTLAAAHYVDFDPKAKTYTLGWAPIVLARRALDPDGLLAHLRPDMNALADRYDVACSVGRITRDERVILIGLAETDRATRIHLRIGQRVPLLAGSSGRCIAAHSGLSADEIKPRFNALRWQNAPTFAEYLSQIEAARQRGWSMDRDQSFRGVTTVSAPIVDETGAVRYVCSVTMFSGQYTDDDLAMIGRDAVALGQRASRRFFDVKNSTTP